MKRFLTILIVLAFVLTIAFAALYIFGYIPGTLEKDERGEFPGTGTKIYRYDSGPTMLEDYYLVGRLNHSKWYRPDGSVIAETHWTKGTNIGYYLRQDGTIRVQMEYLNEKANGPAIHYKEDGKTIDHIKEYRNGSPIKTNWPAAPPK